MDKAHEEPLHAALADAGVLLRALFAAERIVCCIPPPRDADGPVARSLHLVVGVEPVTAEEAQTLENVKRTPALVRQAGFHGLPLRSAGGEVLGALGVWGAGQPDDAVLTAVAHAVSAQLEGHYSLSQARRQLERADRLAMVGRLAAGIAHELGTPLAVVAGRARQLAAGSVPPADQSAVARGIAEQADRMAGIIRQLLDYARRRGPKLGRFDARTLLRQAVALLEPVAERKSVKLVLADMPAACVCHFDGNQMMQVMTNLIANAISATAASGQVLVSLEDVVVQPPPDTALTRGRYVALRVSDTGSGIAPEHLPQLFEPFFTTKDTGEGTGLGLSVAQGIVRDHEGWIAVESQLGKGSSFTVYLPG